MREALRDQEGVRGTFSGTVARFGTKSAYRGAPIPTLMLQDVKDASGKIVVWDAPPIEVDYRLSNPTKVRCK